jgi:hypothetical protein
LNEYLPDTTDEGFNHALNALFTESAAIDGTTALDAQHATPTVEAEARGAVQPEQTCVLGEIVMTGITTAVWNGSPQHLNAFQSSVVTGVGQHYGITAALITIRSVKDDAAHHAIIKWKVCLPPEPPEWHPHFATELPPPAEPHPSTATFATDLVTYMNLRAGDCFLNNFNIADKPSGVALTAVEAEAVPQEVGTPTVSAISTNAPPALSGLVSVPEATIHTTLRLTGVTNEDFACPLMQNAFKETMMNNLAIVTKLSQIVIASSTAAGTGAVLVNWLTYSEEKDIATTSTQMHKLIDLPCLKKSQSGSCLKHGDISPFQTAYNAHIIATIDSVTTETSIGGFTAVSQFDSQFETTFKQVIATDLNIQATQVKVTGKTMSQAGKLLLAYRVHVPHGHGETTAFKLKQFVEGVTSDGFKLKFQAALNALCHATGCTAPSLSGIVRHPEHHGAAKTNMVTATKVTHEPTTAGPGVTVAPTPPPTAYVPGHHTTTCPERPAGGSMIEMMVDIGGDHQAPGGRRSQPTPPPGPPAVGQELSDLLQHGAPLLAEKISALFPFTACDTELTYAPMDYAQYMADINANGGNFRRVLQNVSVLLTSQVYSRPDINATIMAENLVHYYSSPLFLSDLRAVASIVAPAYRIQGTTFPSTPVVTAIPVDSRSWVEKHYVAFVFLMLFLVLLISITVSAIWWFCCGGNRPHQPLHKSMEDPEKYEVELNQVHEDARDLQEAGVGCDPGDAEGLETVDADGEWQKDMAEPGVEDFKAKAASEREKKFAEAMGDDSDGERREV